MIAFFSFIKVGKCVLNTAEECENDPEEPRVPKNRCNSRAGYFDLLRPTLHNRLASLAASYVSIFQLVILDNAHYRKNFSST